MEANAAAETSSSKCGAAVIEDASIQYHYIEVPHRNSVLVATKTRSNLLILHNE